MRKKMNTQPELFCQVSNLKITNEYHARYEAMSEILDSVPGIVAAAHSDLRHVQRNPGRRKGPGRKFRYSSDTVLRILLSQVIEDESLRGIVIRIDDSQFLRSFTRIYNGTMMDYTTLCAMKNAIRPKTWEKINAILRNHAVCEGKISGERLRIDTTAYETNIHRPTDSSLLWDTYRALSRLIDDVREIDIELVGDHRLHPRKAKKLYVAISRKKSLTEKSRKEAKILYSRLIPMVSRLLAWVPELCAEVKYSLKTGCYDAMGGLTLEGLVEQLEHFCILGNRVVDQASRRIFDGEKVPNREKIFSIFEPHTELLIRGKAGKPIEFGHMISIQQVEGKFISEYMVFSRRPIDHELVDPALKSHTQTFGSLPTEFSADKGFYKSMQKLHELEAEIAIVSICKKGSRTAAETARERDPSFKLGQKFRAGIEGSISCLKRVLGLWRCFNKGWEHFVSTVGATVFAHNLLVLVRPHG